MTTTYEQLTNAMQSFSFIQECDTIANGMLRLATPFRYPNGSGIDLFLQPQSDSKNRLEITDLGCTHDYLTDCSVLLGSTVRWQKIIDDICTSLEVEFHEGAFRVFADHVDAVPSSIVRLGQACIRAAELQWSQRFRSALPFKDDVEEAISSWGRIEYEANVPILGKNSAEINIDFLVHGRHSRTAVQTMSTGNRYAAHQMANDTLARFFAIANAPNAPEQRIAIYDASQDIFRKEDLMLLQDLSLVFAYPSQQDAILEALAA